MEKEGLLNFFRQMVDISLEDENRIRERFSAISVPAKRYLLQSGEICQHVYWVVKGCVRVAIENQNGEDISCFFGDEGMFVANYESFLSGKPSPYSLQALESSELLAIDRKGLQELYEGTKNGERIGRLMAEHLFCDILGRLTSFYAETAEQRYLRFVAEFPHLVQRIPQHYIASYIGVRPQSLSRIKRRALMGVAR
jgi:CRP-like cAMP-binding protein